MDKFPVNCQALEQNIAKKTIFKLAEINQPFEKVAFDVVRFVDSKDFKGLWQVNKDDNGEYIVALYDDEEVVKKAESNWSATASGDNVHLYYKNFPVKKIALSQLGIPAADGNLIVDSLQIKLASEPAFVKTLLAELADKESLLAKFPELI